MGTAEVGADRTVGTVEVGALEEIALQEIPAEMANIDHLEPPAA